MTSTDFIDGVICISALTDFTILALILMTLVTAMGITILIGAIKLAKYINFINGSKFFIILAILLFIVGIEVLIVSASLPNIEYLETVMKKPNGMYKVIITDDVDMNEFQEKYNIIDYKDDVYIISIK